MDGFPPPTEVIDGCPRIVERSDGKGDGRITDDTLMVEALIDCYVAHRDHLDARAYQERFAPQLATRDLWIPELQKNMPLLPRLANAEQLHVRGLLRTGRDPRFFGATLAGALGGMRSLLGKWVKYVSEQNQRNPGKTAREFTESIRFLYQNDMQRQHDRHATLAP